MIKSSVWTPEALSHDPHADAEKASKVQAMFAGIARTYDLNNRLHSFGQDQRWRRIAVRTSGVDSTTRVLDVACGTGDLAEAFADAGAASVTGVDFTPQMLDVARHKSAAAGARRAQRAGAASRMARAEVIYEQGDAMALRFADASFDVVSIAFGIRNVAQPLRALAEFARVLRPGGRLVILEFSQPSNALIRLGSSLYTRGIMPWTATLLAGDRTGAYRYLPRSVATFMDSAAFGRTIRDAGFTGVTEKPLSMGICRIYGATRL